MKNLLLLFQVLLITVLRACTLCPNQRKSNIREELQAEKAENCQIHD